MEQEELQQQAKTNEALELQLTKKNEQYVFELKKALKTAEVSEEEVTTILKHMLPKLVEGQKSGLTARKQFGTVFEYVQNYLNKPKAPEKAKPWQAWLDNTLLFFVMLAVLNGIMNLFSKGKGVISGLTSLTVTSAIGGLVFYYMYKWIYQYDRPGADKSKRPKLWKSMLILMGCMIVWIFVYTATMFLPPIINPTVDPTILILLGVAVLGLRFWLKKKYNFTGTFFIR